MPLPLLLQFARSPPSFTLPGRISMPDWQNLPRNSLSASRHRDTNPSRSFKHICFSPCMVVGLLSDTSRIRHGFYSAWPSEWQRTWIYIEKRLLLVRILPKAALGTRKYIIASGHGFFVSALTEVRALKWVNRILSKKSGWIFGPSYNYFPS